MAKPKKALTAELATAFISTAREIHTDEGTLEIDDVEGEEAIAEVSAGESLADIKDKGGAYVKAWVWVENESLPEDIRKKYSLGDD